MQTLGAHRQQSLAHPSRLAGDTPPHRSSSLDGFHAVLLDPSDIEQEILRAYARLSVLPDQIIGTIAGSIYVGCIMSCRVSTGSVLQAPLTKPRGLLV
jgi:hypothetical protein